MSWLTRYRLKLYLENSTWVLPVLAALVALVVVRIIDRFERYEGWRSLIRPDTAQTVLATMTASLFTFIVFVASVLLIAVQLASSQLSPRIIHIIFRDRVTRYSLTLFVFCFSFSIAALARIGDTVPSITTRIAAYSGVASLGAFLYLIDHAGRTLRPSGALSVVGIKGRRVIERVYPRRLDASVAGAAALPVPQDVQPGAASRVVVCHRDGVVLAFDVDGLVALAQRTGCVLELVPQAGDFVTSGDALFRIHDAAAGSARANGVALADDALRRSVALGRERTMEQDPAFAFRIIVDVASKALSPAINDPTTAVLALDQIHHLLRDVGRRHLDDERVRDASGAVRLVYRTPGWDDFVHLAIMEIRQFGAGSVQVARRLRAMLDNLIQVLPSGRTDLLKQELDLLDRSTARLFADPEDRVLAEGADLQGVGAERGRSSGSP
jgi:uncharacterized membrane protein